MVLCQDLVQVKMRFSASQHAKKKQKHAESLETLIRHAFVKIESEEESLR